ncbi:MAG: phosphatase PAP2 family protein [Clostridia bacterium]|nr:phosphatase PAP2 family protein [Clostridia bacterium]
MNFLYLLEGLRTPFWDSFFSTITHFGSETLFMVIALIFFWCLDKKRGYYLLFVGFTGVICTQLLKMSFRISRPWVLDPDFTIVESARADATGYSFPSGHTQCATTLYGGLARSDRRRWVQIGSVILLLAVAFSRMYLGVHTPKDVLVSLGVGTLLVFLFYPLMQKAFKDPKWMYGILGGMSIIALANLLFTLLYCPTLANVEADNLNNAVKVAWQLLFVTLAMFIIYPVDQKWIRFETDAVWWAQLIKLIGGLALVIGVRVLLKSPLNALFGEGLGSGIRYFIMVLVAGLLWPMVFRFFPKSKNNN